MAKPTRYRREPDDEESRPHRARQQSSFPVIPVLLFAALLGAAIWAARALGEDEPTRAAPSSQDSDAPEPFSSVPDEAPPGSHGGGTRAPFGSTDTAPTGVLAGNTTWSRALELAAEAESIFARARTARDQNDVATWQTLGKQAKESFDEAFTITAELEAELIAQYGEGDRQVREMMRKRTQWQERFAALHKMTAR